MHGLINRSIQCFLRDTYGDNAWQTIAASTGLGSDGFEAMLTYETALTQSVLDTACTHLSTTQDMLLEDLGTYLVSHPNVQGLRRLLRFGGASFIDFLHSLDELHDRARLAVPDLDLPQLELYDYGGANYALTVTYPHPGFGHVMVGVLRAMADDYGTLALLNYRGRKDGVDTISVELLDMRFAKGREFELGQRAG